MRVENADAQGGSGPGSQAEAGGGRAAWRALGLLRCLLQIRLLCKAEEAMMKLAEPSTTTAVDDMPTAADTNSGVDRDNGSDSDGEVDMFVGGGIDLPDKILAEDGE